MLSSLLIILLALVICDSTAAVSESHPAVAANLSAYNATCAKSNNLELNRICSGLPNATLRLFGEDFDESYLRGKVESRVFVGLILSKCQPGEYCVHLAQSEPSELEDRLLLSWRDPRVRDSLCGLRPCLAGLPPCGGSGGTAGIRRLTFQAVKLLCGLTELRGGDVDGVPRCLAGSLDLLQYAFADLGRKGAAAADAAVTTAGVCDCVGRRKGSRKTNNSSAAAACPDECRQMIYKLNCLNNQCLPHERKHIASFPAWSWYFTKAGALKAKYNVTFCERPIESVAAALSGNRGPVIFAFFPNVNNVILAVVLVVVIAALLMVGVTCLCWQRIFLNKYSRDRVQYTEVKGTL